MTKLVSVYITSILLGALMSLSFIVMVWFTNVGNLQQLMLSRPEGIVPTVMLFISGTVLFTGVVFGYRIMSLARN